MEGPTNGISASTQPLAPVEPAAQASGSPALQGERVTFTGTLASMTHAEAQRVVEAHGGAATSNISHQTTMLVIGEEGWPLEPDGQPSQKLQLALKWRAEGQTIHTLQESEWLHLVGLDERRSEVQRVHTAAQLSKMLDVSVGTIRRWERMGLIRAARRVRRLLYFDFQEVSGARRIANWLESGVSRVELKAAFDSLRSVMPDVDRSLAQLEILSRDSRLLYRDDHGLVVARTGQRVLDFDDAERDRDAAEVSVAHETHSMSGSHWFAPQHDEQRTFTADEWFQRGCEFLEHGPIHSAMEAFRCALMQQPAEPEMNFHLAEALYRAGNAAGALERYYAAVESDHEYIESWMQLACIHAELDQLDFAKEAFEIALKLHPEYPDAHFHLAGVLTRLGDHAEAANHWSAYLEHDTRGPWAEIARQHLDAIAAPGSEVSCSPP